MPTAALASDAGLAAKIEPVGDNGPADGLIISRHDGRMYISSPEDSALKVRDLTAKGSKPTVLLKDARRRWPDTFAEASDGTIYVTTLAYPGLAFYKPGAPAALPTELWSVKPGA